MATPVDIFVSSTDVVPVPLAGVTVGVFDSGAAVAGMAATDADGKVSFLLPGATYEVRLFKLGTAFGAPKRILVEEPPVTTNKFDVSGSVLTFPPSLDPRICRCTGRFMDLANRPMLGAVLRVSQRAEAGFEAPKVVDGNLIAAEGASFKTDLNGIITADLLRGGEYYVMFSGESDAVWNIRVPDRASINLIDLIHPQPVSLRWDSTVAPGNAVSLAVNDTLIVPFSILFSDYEELSTGISRWVQLASSDTSIVTVALASEKAALRGVAPGTAQISASVPTGQYPVRVPDYAMTVPPLQVTIS